MGLLGSEANPDPGCLPTVRSELSPCRQTAWYSVRDPISGRFFDQEASFGPQGVHVLLFKLIASTLVLGSLAYCIWESDSRDWFWTDLAHIALALQGVYHILSFVHSTSCLANCRRKESDDEDYLPNHLKFTWFLLNLSLHASATATFLYWTQDGSGHEWTLAEILPHGPAFLVTLFDGLVTNRIPIRLFHWWSTALPLHLSWMAWTLVEAYTVVGRENEYTTTVYQGIEWKDDPVGTTIRMVMLIFVVGPAVQFVLFLLSLYAWPLCCHTDRRRYLTGESIREVVVMRNEEAVEQASITGAESVSIFAGWGNAGGKQTSGATMWVSS